MSVNPKHSSLTQAVPFITGLCALLVACGGGGAAVTKSSEAAAGGTTTTTEPTTAASSGGSTTSASTTYVDASLLPAAQAGSSERLIRATSAQPYRDPDGMGAFRTVCQYSHMNFDDPLVYPGQVGRSHLHVFFGNSDTNANSTPDSIATSGNGTCRGGIVNRSGYWVPAIIDTRDGRPVQPGRDHDIYYKTGYDLFGQNDAVRAFPARFRMIGGDSKSTVAQKKAYFECNGTRSDTLPNCPNGELHQIVEFPQCWDGVNLDSPDHRSHIVYASNGTCPSTHPVHTPEVTYKIKYNVPASGSSTWRLSSDINGAPAGTSGHGDWVNGWEQEVMQTFVNNIIRQGLSGGSDLVGDGRSIYYNN